MALIISKKEIIILASHPLQRKLEKNLLDLFKGLSFYVPNFDRPRNCLPFTLLFLFKSWLYNDAVIIEIFFFGVE
jgi:hypothetical protein